MTTIYQAADGQWIAFNGQTKQYFATEREARMANRPSAAQEWESALREIIGSSRTLISAAQELSLLASTNDISGTIASTPDGELLDGTTITKADAADRAALFEEMMTWLQQPGPNGLPRIVTIYRRF